MHRHRLSLSLVLALVVGLLVGLLDRGHVGAQMVPAPAAASDGADIGDYPLGIATPALGTSSQALALKHLRASQPSAPASQLMAGAAGVLAHSRQARRDPSGTICLPLRC